MRQVSIPTKIAYGAGQGMSSVKDMLFHFFFLFYFSNLLGVPEYLVIISSSIALIFDAISDPLAGYISDRFRSKKWGRRHLFMLVATPPSGIFLALLFSPPADMSITGLFIWMTLFSILVRIALTFFRVPYYSLGAELSDQYNERTNIVSIREVLNGLFNLSVFIIGFNVFLPDNEAFEDGMLNVAGYSPLAITVALLGCLGGLIAFAGTFKEIPRITESHEGNQAHHTNDMPFLVSVKSAMAMKSFQKVTFSFSAMAVLYGVNAALGLYYAVYLWELSQLEKTFFAAIPVLTLLPSALSASFLSAKFEKKEAGLFFSIFFLIGSALPYILFLLGIISTSNSNTLLITVLTCHALASFGITGVIIICYSMLADIADEFTLISGSRQEGILYSALSFIQKLTFTLGTGIASVVLIVSAFPKQMEPSLVPQSAISALAWAGMIAGLCLGLATVYFFSGYELSRRRLNSIQSRIREER